MFDTDGLRTIGFWEMLWVRVWGKRHKCVNEETTVIWYVYKADIYIVSEKMN